MQYYPLARKVHRFCVLFMVVLGLAMTGTGSVMKYAFLVTPVLPSVDLLRVRQLHAILSPFFGIILLAMMVSGGYMYLYPWLLRRVKKTGQKKSPTP